MNNKISERLEQSTLRIYEGLYKIAESASVEELNEKINTIMDALGLDVNTSDDVKEPEIKETEDSIEIEDDGVENDIEVKDTAAAASSGSSSGNSSSSSNNSASSSSSGSGVTDNGDTITIDESLKPDGEVEVSEKQNGYRLDITKYIIGYDGDGSLEFETLPEVIAYINEHIPLRFGYNDMTKLQQADFMNSAGNIFSNPWFDIIKLDHSEEEGVE